MQVKTKNLAVSALIVVLVGALWYRVVYSPMESKASKAKTAAHDADTSSANLRQALTGSTSGAQKAKKPDVSTQAMLQAVPVDAAEASFLRSIDDIRVSSGADWQSVSPTAPSVSGTIATINVAISVQGTEDEIARYMESLTTLKRVFILDSVAISQGGSKSPAGSGPVQGQAGAVFIGDLQQLQISGRIFASPAAVAATTTGATGTPTTPTTGAPAPTSGAAAPTGTVNG